MKNIDMYPTLQHYNIVKVLVAAMLEKGMFLEDILVRVINLQQHHCGV